MIQMAGTCGQNSKGFQKDSFFYGKLEDRRKWTQSDLEILGTRRWRIHVFLDRDESD